MVQKFYIIFCYGALLLLPKGPHVQRAVVEQDPRQRILQTPLRAHGHSECLALKLLVSRGEEAQHHLHVSVLGKSGVAQIPP